MMAMMMRIKVKHRNDMHAMM